MKHLVMIHGFMGGSGQWDMQKATLADRYDVIALDLPGFGLNANLTPINTIGGFAEWVIAQLSARNIGHFSLLGHSMGGMIAQEIASRIPDQIERLILYSTGAIGVLPGRFETIAQSKARTLADGPKVTARRIAESWFLKGTAATAFESCASIAEQASLDAILAGLSAMEGWAGEAALANIRAKTLLVWGDKDRTYPWEQIETLWRTIPQTSLCVLPNVAHAIHLENPEGFNRVLTDYLESCGAQIRPNE
ncbi:alpha/beta fold hydrolase [Roseobacter sp. CCS2]|uniref:alpha/beta fold hydrolase n=1 Tax=Roseobacter sp. CCS2 TaxID=391593 RepID=UPI0000F3E497|nr:alpha/beta hydrolase [Roseobacter sp. CCS2]EBA12232.1 hydrolase, putative [Roseobacter sp. CCS2]